MKFFIALLLTALLSFAACLYLPWWSIAVAAFVVAVAIKQTPTKSFLSGFTALLLLWGGLSFYISSANGHDLAQKVSMLLIKNNNAFVLVFITALLGALVGGLAALTGALVLSKK
jgi:hypothetical protein